MADVRITPAAKVQLLDIWKYTTEQWDEDQADASPRDIKTALDRLAENPMLGIFQPEIFRCGADIHLGYGAYPAVWFGWQPELTLREPTILA